MTVPAGQSVPYTVTFMPQSSGTTSASVAIVSNATNSPATESLTGSGVAAAQHSVTLAWAASTTQSVVGYNVYRSTVLGGPYAQITSASDVNSSYTDSAVSSGTSYFYVVTAVDGTGAESAYSNQAQAVVPTP
jgi:fibronectin type 3 domain-containing protein